MFKQGQLHFRAIRVCRSFFRYKSWPLLNETRTAHVLF